MTRDRHSDRVKPKRPPDRGGDACVATATDVAERAPSSQIPVVTIARRLAWVRSMPARCPPECPDGASAKDAAAFNTHSLGGGGSGLAQHVFRSPARIQPRSPEWGPVRRAAKRKTLYVIISEKAGSRAGVPTERVAPGPRD